MNWWNVYLNRELVDSISCDYKTAEEVKYSLINHDGYNSDIVVRKVRKQPIKKERQLDFEGNIIK